MATSNFHNVNATHIFAVQLEDEWAYDDLVENLESEFSKHSDYYDYGKSDPNELRSFPSRSLGSFSDSLTIGDDGSGLSGTLRFYHSPLLYVDVLLKYVPFSDPELVAAPIVNSFGEVVQDVPTAIEIAYYLDEKRRVKLTDLHYLDSSNIGAIISVWPIDDAIE